MAYEILSESYGRRLAKITATATSTGDLATLGTDWAEGSTCTISDTTYKLDKVKGWVDPSSGGGASAFTVTFLTEDWSTFTADKTVDEIAAAYEAGTPVFGYYGSADNPMSSIQIVSAMSGDYAYASFQTWYVEDEEETSRFHIITIYIDSEDAVTYSETVYTLTPET